MPKAQLTEQRLIEVINVAFEHNWPHTDRPCRVEALREVTRPDRNWEVDTYSTSGSDLLHSPDCDDIRQRVLEALIPNYDVLWKK